MVRMTRAEREAFRRVGAIGGKIGGAKGGRIGGKRSLETMTPEARRERASRAGKASAAKRKADKKDLFPFPPGVAGTL